MFTLALNEFEQEMKGMQHRIGPSLTEYQIIFLTILSSQLDYKQFASPAGVLLYLRLPVRIEEDNN